MKKRQVAKLPEPVCSLRDKVEQWRQRREKRTAMPEELWLEAASLSKTYGVYPVARDLRLHYDRLKKRVFGGAPRTKTVEGAQDGFVEVTGIECFKKAEESVATEVEVCRADGSTLRIRQSGSQEMDLPGLVEAFCRIGR